MGRYPKAVRAASIKCIECNSPVVETVDDEYRCVECGESPIQSRSTPEPAVSATTGSTADRSVATDD